MPRRPSEAVLARLGRLHPKVIDLSLGRVAALLARLGHPEQRLPPVVHIAGTNGKGSTLAFLRAMLGAAGLRVHVSTSPHLVRFNERICLAGEPIGESVLTALLEEVERVNDARPITFFEITQAAAFLAFARHPADVLLLETGLGGRFDATNVVDRPALTIITPVSHDHEAFLGDTLAAIAFEKAGILKPGCPAVIAPQHPDAAAVIAARAAEIDAPLITDIAHRFYTAADPGDDRLEVRIGATRVDLPRPALEGPHQFANAALAVAAARALPAPLRPNHAAMAAGVAGAQWPGRMQRLGVGPGGGVVWLDGGHNVAAAECLAATLADLAARDRRAGRVPRPIHGIMGMLDNRDPVAFLRPLAPHLASLQAVAIPGSDNCHSCARLIDAARSAGIAQASAAADVGAAVAARPGTDRVIFGSLYLAGAVLGGPLPVA